MSVTSEDPPLIRKTFRPLQLCLLARFFARLRDLSGDDHEETQDVVAALVEARWKRLVDL